MSSGKFLTYYSPAGSGRDLERRLTRREFLKIAALSLGVVGMRPFRRLFQLPDFPAYERLARVTKGRVDVKAEPNHDSQTVKVLYEDTVLPWLQERVGSKTSLIFSNQRWVETPDGYIFGSLLQPVKNQPNQPIRELPSSSLGQGMWMEITVPYVDAFLAGGMSSNSWVSARVEAEMPLRFYYSQVFWVDRIQVDEQGRVFYRVNPNYYGGVDMLWAPAEAFRPLTPEDLAPISPDVEEKRVVVDVNHQVLSCYEGASEVFFTRVSTGAKFDAFGNVVDVWATPLGRHKVTRKYVSLQMSGGTTGAGYDLPGIGWAVIFATGGVATHSTFWHNNFGDPMSRGCVNLLPQEARWVFRWLMPVVPYDPGMKDITVTGEESTIVQVIEG
jgi:lipoprotein-anchoring transpeptidase ErfK/SrfK